MGKCECGKEGEDCIDPYILDMDGEEVETCLCDDCYKMRVQDI